MGLQAKMTMEFSQDELKKIIKDYCRREGFEPVGDVQFNTGSRLEGYGVGERDVTYFDGASIQVKKKESTSYNSSPWQGDMPMESFNEK